MQTSEEPGRLSHKENTANSLLIIQTSGLAFSSSWGFTQEAQLRMLAEGGRCLPEPGASSCAWSAGPAAPEDRRWFGCYKHSAHPFQNITPVTTTTAPTGHKFTLPPSTHMECANTQQHLTTAARLGGIAHLPHHGHKPLLCASRSLCTVFRELANFFAYVSLESKSRQQATPPKPNG